MDLKTLWYVALDIMIIAGVIVSIFVKKDIELLLVFVPALVGNLIHQLYTEKNYFKNMFDQGRPFLVNYWYPFLRWAFTIMAIAFVVAFILDYIATT